MRKKKIVVLSGAGMSADSGLSTFRDQGGLWENHAIAEVATPEAWNKNPDLVNRFYNARREQLLSAMPNEGHRALVRLESHFKVVIVTQNVDDLHERAGSRHVIHLHGELRKVRSTGDPGLVYTWDGPLGPDDRCEKGYPLRPHIVWFGEEVPLLGMAATEVSHADVVIVVGTSLQVYPAAGLLYHAPPHARLIYIDPHPAPMAIESVRLTILAKRAAEALPGLVEQMLMQI
jgi:NAD-dependent deacetylase